MKRAVPPRIAFYAAEAVPVVVAILRVRSKWWHVIRIDEQGQVERGSWFKGAKIMLDQCSLNDDGTLFAYLATGDGGVGWSGICRPPWLRCVVQVSTWAPFMSACAFGFESPGKITLRSPLYPFSLSKFDPPVTEVDLARLVGATQARQIKEQATSDRAKEDREWLRLEVEVRTELRMQLVRQKESMDRMSRQGFSQAEMQWKWTGRDGVCRIIPAERPGDNDPASLHSLNCCVDPLGRCWQALDGIITCHEIRKSGSRLAFSIDTTSWIPPRRMVQEEKS